RDASVIAAQESLGRGQVHARISAEDGSGFLLAVVELVYLRPLGPRVVRGAIHGRLGKNLDLHQAAAAVAHGGADTIGAGVSAPDNHYVKAGRGDVVVAGTTVEEGLR